MTITATDMFCGAGGSSLGAEGVPGVSLRLGLNHWKTAIDVHQQHFPEAGHDCADISAADPRRYQRTDILLASPECTNQTGAKGVSRKKQNPSLWDAPDPAAERSRATMWDVPRFAEEHAYDVIVTENVVEAKDWILWHAWHVAMEALGYEHKVLSINSMHHGVPQSRDRIYVVFWRKGIRIDLTRTSTAWCPRCERIEPCRQAWKNGRIIGEYRQQWVWICCSCATIVDPEARPAADIIDWSLPCPPISERRYKNGKPKPALVPATRARILAGLQRHGYAPIITAGAGNVYETTPGNRSRPLTKPLPVQQTTATHALVTPAFLMRNNGGGAEMTTPVDEPARTITTKGHQSLLMPYYKNGQAQPTDRPAPTVTTKDRCALIDPKAIVDECGYRMLEPHEIAAAMAFPVGYIPGDLPKKHQVKLAGNAVTPPVMRWIVSRVAAALESAA